MDDLTADYLNERVVVDTDSRLSYLGTLTAISDSYLKLANVAIYDEERIRVSLEEYLIEAVNVGVSESRRETLVRLPRVIAVSRLSDIIDPLKDTNEQARDG
jgi:small nuclear ribonucleoprotein (snRNP)-like protein